MINTQYYYKTKEKIFYLPTIKNNSVLRSRDMNAVKNNPYRILGLLGNSSERELQRQIATIKRFLEVGKNKVFEYDFPFLGEIDRNIEKVQEAASRIEQAKNKVHYALFWFLKNGHIDETALNNLKEGHIEKAGEIWKKTINGSSITAKNFTAINNLSTLQLGIATYNGSFDIEKFTTSVELKGKILLSEMFNNFVTTLIGQCISIDRDIILKEFADEILQIVKPYLNKPNGIKPSQLINAFSSYPNEIKQYVTSKFTDGPLNNIENQIEITKQKRKDDPEEANEYGEELYKNTKEDLNFLKNVWGENNVQYQMIANKLANEILQCAIDFFLEYRDSDEYDPGEPAMKVMKMAKAINPTGQIKSRIDENINDLQEWIDSSAQREKLKNIKSDIEFITLKLLKFQVLPNTISNAKDLIVTCKPKLNKIKAALGSSDELYLNLSSAVVNNALNALISEVNNEQNALQWDRTKIITLPTTINSAMEVMNIMSTMDMVFELRSRFNQNKTIISRIQSQLNQITNRLSSNSSSGGCYIATMVYGSYEHPKVLELRKFRDKTLSKSSFGRFFIKTYYKYSPKLVEHLKDKPLVNQTIKFILNTLIRIIK